MADDSTFRSTRLGDPYPRADRSTRPSDSAAEADPLAELARLIGKNDPYAEFGLRDSYSGQPEETGSRADFERNDRRYALPQEPPEEPHYDESFRTADQDDETSQHLPLANGLRGDQWPADNQPAYREPGFESPVEEDEYSDPQHAQEQDGHGAEQGFHDPSEFDHYEDQMYDDPPRARRHGGLVTALALIGCAVLGTAGAYAYRSYSSQPAGAQVPPVITADSSTPTKIVPAPNGNAQSSKFIQERLANAGKEQVISKQEEPVALNDLGTQAAPRVVLPAPVAPSSGASASQSSAAASAAPGSNEPKKVRTLAIRPDGTDASPKPGVAAGPPGSPPSRSTGSPDARGAGPLSLDPQAGPTPAAPAPRVRTATAPVPARPEPSATAGAGGVLVQLSSQKTEAEATASFRSLQAKFPDELGGRHPIVRRADLGTKGVFYRTMVGPFASAQEANQFCANYKAAGGHCVVPTH